MNLFSDEWFKNKRTEESKMFKEKGYEFTEDWFHVGTKYDLKQVLKVNNKKELHFLEIGAYEGRSATWFIDNYLHHEKSSITIIDPFLCSDVTSPVSDNTYRLFKNNIKNVSYPDKVNFFKNKSIEILPTLLADAKKYDVIFIDGSHLLKDVLEDIVISWNLLKTKGFLIMDDYKSDSSPVESVCEFYFTDRQNVYKKVFERYQAVFQKNNED